MVIQICSKCLTLLGAPDNPYRDRCQCRAEAFTYAEDELEDYGFTFEELAEVYKELPKKDQVAVSYFMKG